MQETKSIPKMETIKQVAKTTGLAEYFVRQLVKQNKIKFVKAGTKYLLNLDSLIEYLNNGEGQNVWQENTNNVRKAGM